MPVTRRNVFKTIGALIAGAVVTKIAPEKIEAAIDDPVIPTENPCAKTPITENVHVFMQLRIPPYKELIAIPLYGLEDID